VSGARSTHGGEKEYIQNFGGKEAIKKKDEDGLTILKRIFERMGW
jgi:hypothetical protein